MVINKHVLDWLQSASESGWPRFMKNMLIHDEWNTYINLLRRLFAILLLIFNDYNAIISKRVFAKFSAANCNVMRKLHNLPTNFNGLRLFFCFFSFCIRNKFSLSCLWVLIIPPHRKSFEIHNYAGEERKKLINYYTSRKRFSYYESSLAVCAIDFQQFSNWILIHFSFVRIKINKINSIQLKITSS